MSHVVRPAPSCRVVRLQHALHHPLCSPSSSSRVICRPPTVRQHRHCLVAASSSSPLPLSLSRPLLALACHQRKDIATTIVNTISSLQLNKGIHHCEESHGVCHSREPFASSGATNVVGIAPPRRRRRRAATAGDPPEGSGEGGAGKLSSQKRLISPARDIIASQEAESVVSRRFVHPLPRYPLPPSCLATAAPTTCPGKAPHWQ